MDVLLFHQRFENAVRSGAKRQTIRIKRNRPIVPGADLSLRAWGGVPYRSKQIVIRESVCVRVSNILITDSAAIIVGNRDLTPNEKEEFAIADGFKSFSDLMTYFRGKTPFFGDLIEWERSEC